MIIKTPEHIKSNEQCQQALLIFVKNPVLGDVKTRLAQSVGHEKALYIYRALLGHANSVTSAVDDCNRIVYYSQEIVQDDIWDTALFQKRKQVLGDIGERMQSAFLEAFQDGMEQVVLIGSDCPKLSPSHIEEAFQALNHYDVVYGPAIDGGYYLVGLNKPQSHIFDLSAWSTSKVMAESIRICSENGLKLRLLEALPDVDYIADWEAHGWAL